MDKGVVLPFGEGGRSASVAVEKAGHNVIVAVDERAVKDIVPNYYVFGVNTERAVDYARTPGADASEIVGVESVLNGAPRFEGVFDKVISYC